jgi:site-specific DNA recombinase
MQVPAIQRQLLDSFSSLDDGLATVPCPLLRLIAHAFAAQDLLLSGKPSPMIADYSQRHLQQVTRLSYLAPDIIAAIVDGTQPVDLTGRKILRIGSVPLCWTEQRELLGFN